MASEYKIYFDSVGRPYQETGGRKRFLTPTEAGTYSRMFIRDPAQQQEALASDFERGIITPEDLQRLNAYTRAYQVTPDNPSGVTPTKNGYASKVKFNPNTGEWDHSMGAGLSGTLQGAAAVAAPMVIGPAIASMFAPAAGAAGGGAAGGGAAGGGASSLAGGAGAVADIGPAISTPIGAANAAAIPTAGAIPFSTAPGISAAAGSGAVAPAAGLGAGAPAGSLAAGNSSWLAGQDWGKIGGSAADAISNASETAAGNRSTKLSAQAELERLMLLREQQLQKQQIDREAEGRAGASDAYRKLLSSQHLLSPGAAPQLAGKYNVAPREATETERAGAQALSDEVMKRLQGGNPIPAVTQHPLEYDKSLWNAGKGEKVGNWLGPAAKIASLFKW